MARQGAVQGSISHVKRAMSELFMRRRAGPKKVYDSSFLVCFCFFFVLGGENISDRGPEGI